MPQMTVLPVIATPATSRCGDLRSKSSYAAYGDFHEEHAELMGASATFWCLRTMSKAGPDDHFVHRGACTPDRSCFHAPEDIA